MAMANASRAKIIAADVPSPGMWPTGSALSTGPRQKGHKSWISVFPSRPSAARAGRPDAYPGANEDKPQGGGGRGACDWRRAVSGAPYLAGLGALRAGADIVRIASPVF